MGRGCGGRLGWGVRSAHELVTAGTVTRFCGSGACLYGARDGRVLGRYRMVVRVWFGYCGCGGASAAHDDYLKMHRVLKRGHRFGCVY